MAQGLRVRQAWILRCASGPLGRRRHRRRGRALVRGRVWLGRLGSSRWRLYLVLRGWLASGACARSRQEHGSQVSAPLTCSEVVAAAATYGSCGGVSCSGHGPNTPRGRCSNRSPMAMMAAVGGHRGPEVCVRGLVWGLLGLRWLASFAWGQAEVGVMRRQKPASFRPLTSLAAWSEQRRTCCVRVAWPSRAKLGGGRGRKTGWKEEKCAGGLRPTCKRRGRWMSGGGGRRSRAAVFFRAKNLARRKRTSPLIVGSLVPL